ncbi:hypothetical protein [Virgibacillus kimchii]
MALQDAINKNIQIRFKNLLEELVGHVTVIYQSKDWLLARLVDIENFGIWLENPNHIRISVRDEVENPIQKTYNQDKE